MEKQIVTLEMYLGKASSYLTEDEDFDMESDTVKEENDEELGAEGADEVPEELPPVDDEGSEEPVEELGDEEGSEEVPEGDMEEIEEKSDEDITIKDVAAAVKTLSKNLATTQKKIGGINFNGITFQKQNEVLEALKNVYNSARGFANEMATFNSLEWK